jgi:hypothetical protein
VVLGLDFTALPLLGRCYTTCVTHQPFFVLVIFWIGSHSFAQGQPGMQSYLILATYLGKSECHHA